jgi:putative tryptophan/tyrosine transport system substrate-binding protein
VLSYGPDLESCFRRLAFYADRIFRGAKPADIPVELPTKVSLAINLQAAKAIGLAVSPSLLSRADKVFA